MTNLEPQIIDIAFIGDRKGSLTLYDDKLVFESKKNVMEFPLHTIRKLNFEKKTFVTSTLFVNDTAITVCRAHIWNERIRLLNPGIP